MKRVILDHYRRWWRVLAVVALAELGLGWLIALGPQYTFEFWTLCLALWAGAVLLSFDFQRGLLRIVATLPLSGRQLGRSWWVGTVVLPALGLTVLMFSGALACQHFLGKPVFPVGQLAWGSLFTLFWLGVDFTVVFNAARGMGTDRKEWVYNVVVNGLGVVTFFSSMILCLDASRSLVKSGILFSFGAFLTVVGWFRAESFDPALAGIYLGKIFTPSVLQRGSLLNPALKPEIGGYRVPAGNGGIPFLISTMVLRAFSYGIFMVGLMALLWWVQGQLVKRAASDVNMWAMMLSFMPCWFLVFYQFMPFLRHLRVLRAAPVSASVLAGGMLAMVVLPVAAVGALVSGVAWLGAGTEVGVIFLNSYAFCVASAALCVFIAAWRGTGVQAYAWLLVGLVGFVIGYLSLQGRFHWMGMPLGVVGAIAAPSLVVSFVLTRWVLVRSSLVYRVQGDCFGRVAG